MTMKCSKKNSYLTQLTNKWCQAQQTLPAPNCRILPPGEFNSMTPILLLIYSEGVIMLVVAVFQYRCHVNKHRKK